MGRGQKVSWILTEARHAALAAEVVGRSLVHNTLLGIGNDLHPADRVDVLRLLPRRARGTVAVMITMASGSLTDIHVHVEIVKSGPASRVKRRGGATGRRGHDADDDGANTARNDNRVRVSASIHPSSASPIQRQDDPPMSPPEWPDIVMPRRSPRGEVSS